MQAGGAQKRSSVPGLGTAAAPQGSQGSSDQPFRWRPQFVGILSAVPVYGLDAVVAACATAVNACTVSRDVVLNLLSRTTDEAPEPVETSHP